MSYSFRQETPDLNDMKSKVLYFILGILICLGIGAKVGYDWQPPKHDDTMIGVGTDDELLGVDSFLTIASHHYVDSSIATIGGGSLNYYEVMARLHMKADSTIEIDTIFLNTFPGSWVIGTVANQLEAGIEFNCPSCDGTVTFTNDYPKTANLMESVIQNGFVTSEGGAVLYFLNGYPNNDKSTGWVPQRIDGKAFHDNVVQDAYPYFMLHFKWYHT